MKKPEAPCADCPKKGCGAYHSKCPEYIEYAENAKKYRKNISISRNSEWIPINSMAKRKKNEYGK